MQVLLGNGFSVHCTTVIWLQITVKIPWQVAGKGDVVTRGGNLTLFRAGEPPYLQMP